VAVCERLRLAVFQCIVQSYLQWLQDSDYNPNCRLCNTPLAANETVRLVCYGKKPRNRSRAGKNRPTSAKVTFSSLDCRVLCVLCKKKKKKKKKKSLCLLPLQIEDPEPAVVEDSQDVTDYTDWSSFNTSSVSAAEEAIPSTQSAAYSYSSALSHPSQPEYGKGLNNGGVEEGHSVISMNTMSNETVTISAASSPRKVYDTRDSGKTSVTQIDFDEDKYRRRPALSWFAQVLKSRSSGVKRPTSMMQRFFVILLIGVIGFLTLIIIMSKLGRASTENDPNLDPMLNPHIRVGQE
uniref:Zinc finger protein-like 1 n=1 Tax=Latimeria chalumnae TaxID=7897 RepID=H3AC44_LATCH